MSTGESQAVQKTATKLAKDQFWLVASDTKITKISFRKVLDMDLEP